MTNQSLPCRDLVETLRNRMAEATKQLPDDWQDFAVEFTEDLNALMREMKTRAQSSAPEDGEAVAWISRQHLATLRSDDKTNPLGAVGALCYSRDVISHNYQKEKMLPLYTGQVISEVATDEMFDAASDAYNDVYTAEVLSNGCGADNHTQALRAAIDAALSTSRSNDKGTEGG